MSISDPECFTLKWGDRGRLGLHKCRGPEAGVVQDQLQDRRESPAEGGDENHQQGEMRGGMGQRPQSSANWFQPGSMWVKIPEWCRLRSRPDKTVIINQPSPTQCAPVTWGSPPARATPAGLSSPATGDNISKFSWKYFKILMEIFLYKLIQNCQLHSGQRGQLWAALDTDGNHILRELLLWGPEQTSRLHQSVGIFRLDQRAAQEVKTNFKSFLQNKNMLILVLLKSLQLHSLGTKLLC